MQTYNNSNTTKKSQIIITGTSSRLFHTTVTIQILKLRDMLFVAIWHRPSIYRVSDFFRLIYSEMQFLTASTLLYARVAVFVWFAFLLVKSPLTLTESNIVMLLGQAMHLPTVQISESNPLLGISAIFLAMISIADVVPLLAENIAYFETVVPTRLMFTFVLGSFCLASDFGLVANNLVFSYAFLEIWFNFLIYNNLKSEKYYRAKKFLEEHADEIREQADAQIIPIA